MKKLLLVTIILLIIPLLFSCFLSCSKDSDDIIDSEQTQDNDNEDTDLYSLSDMSGYYVDSEAWNNCQRRINELGNSSYFKETYLDDEILSEGVYGFYIPTTGRAYELFFEPTTTLYSNNQAAGNKIVHTWNAVNDIKVYFEQTIGSYLQQSEWGAGPGCPLGKRLAFDLNTTLEESKRLNNEYFDCPNPEPGMPCFYYSHGKNPLSLQTLLGRISPRRISP